MNQQKLAVRRRCAWGVAVTIAALTIGAWASYRHLSQGCRVFQGHRMPVHAVAFSPDGNTLASGGYDCTLMLWDPVAGAVIAEFDPAEGRFPGYGNIRGTPYDILNRDGPAPAINSLAFSPDGTSLVVGDDDRAIRIFDLVQKRERLRIELDPSKHGFGNTVNTVNSVAFAPDGRSIAAGSEDGIIRLWGSQRGNLLREIHTETGPVSKIAFAPDGKTVVSAGRAAVYAWDCETGEIKLLIKSPTGNGMEVMAITPDGQYIAAAVEDGLNWAVYVWEYRTREIASVINGDKRRITCLSYSPDGGVLAAGMRPLTPNTLRDAVAHSYTNNGDIVLWKVGNGEKLTTLRGHTGPVRCIAFSPDGKTLASGADDAALRLWNVERYAMRK